MSRECRLSDLGSPPQVRGKQMVFGADVFSRRITPAGAGKTGMMESLHAALLRGITPAGAGKTCRRTARA